VPRCVPFLEPKLALISGEWHKEAWCQRRGQVGTELKIIRCAGTPFSSCGGRYRGGWLDKGSNNPKKISRCAGGRISRTLPTRAPPSGSQ
jgi:hypothetical protein